MRNMLKPLLRLVTGRRPADREFADSSQLEVREEWALPPLSPPEVAAVLREADKAAMNSGGGAPSRGNPYPEGSRQHRLWADRFESSSHAPAPRR